VVNTLLKKHGTKVFECTVPDPPSLDFVLLDNISFEPRMKIETSIISSRRAQFLANLAISTSSRKVNFFASELMKDCGTVDTCKYALYTKNRLFEKALDCAMNSKGRFSFVAAFRTLHGSSQHNAAGFRKGYVYVDRRCDHDSYVPPPPDMVRRHIDSLTDFICENRKLINPQHGLAFSYYVSMKLLSIHPFEDANGRVSRVLLIKAASLFGIDPVIASLFCSILYTKHLEDYHASLMNFCVSGDPSEAFAVFAKACRTLERTVYFGHVSELADIDFDNLCHGPVNFCFPKDSVSKRFFEEIFL